LNELIAYFALGGENRPPGEITTLRRTKERPWTTLSEEQVLESV
jgi:hypothetical protein